MGITASLNALRFSERYNYQCEKKQLSQSDTVSGDYFIITLTPEGREEAEKTLRVDGTSVTVTDLTPSVTYRIRVKARRQGRDSRFSHSLVVRLPRGAEALLIRPIHNQRKRSPY